MAFSDQMNQSILHVLGQYSCMQPNFSVQINDSNFCFHDFLKQIISNINPSEMFYAKLFDSIDQIKVAQCFVDEF